MKRLLAVILTAALVFQAGVFTVFADTSEEKEQIITISNINSSSTEIQATGLPAGALEIVDVKWNCPEEFVISGEDIEIKGGKYSYKLVIRANGTLTFDNDLEILYQGINGKYRLNYEIDETDNHIMIVTGAFEKIIVESPLLEKIPAKWKDWILSHISEDSYFYQLNLRTKEGFTFTNMLRFLIDAKPHGYSIRYLYDKLTNKQKLIIDKIKDEAKTEPEIQTGGKESASSAAPAVASKTGTKKPAVKGTKKQAANKFAIKNAKRKVKAGKVTKGVTISNKGTGTKIFKIKAVNKKKYARFFKINKRSGKIKINKRAPKGTYVLTVVAKAGKTKTHKASGWKRAKVVLVVV